MGHIDWPRTDNRASLTMNTPQFRSEYLNLALDYINRAHGLIDWVMISNWSKHLSGLCLLSSDQSINVTNGFNELHSRITSCEYISPYFGGDHLIFIDGELADGLVSGKESRFNIDYSIGFDLNVVAELRTLCFKKSSSGSRDKLLDILRHKVKYTLNTDHIGYLLEEFSHSGSFSASNNRPLESLAALKMLDHLKWDGCDHDSISFDCSEKHAREIALSIINDDRLKAVIQTALPRQMLLNALLLKINLNVRKRLSPIDSYRDILKLCVLDFGVVAKMELYFVYQIIFSPTCRDFAFPIYQTTGDRLKKIRGMSWDLQVFRLHETLITMQSTGRFFIPYYATFDKKFRALQKAFPLKHVLFDRGTKEIISLFYDEEQFAMTTNEAMAGLARVRRGLPDIKTIHATVMSLESQITD